MPRTGGSIRDSFFYGRAFANDEDLNEQASRWLDATAAAAVIDRIVHHATVLTTAGDSFRLKAATRNHASRMPQEVPRQ